MQSATKEMNEWFKSRTAKHIRLVREMIEKIIDKYPEFSALRERGKQHDASKYQDPEKDAYVWISWMYKHKNTGKPFKYPAGVEEKAHEATEHHILNNPHHPEYHAGKSGISKKDRDSAVRKVDATSMPDLDVAEMVADWAAMSKELGEGSPRAWYEEKSKTRWKFSLKQKALIAKLLKIFDMKEIVERLNKIQSTLKESYDVRGGDRKLITVKGKFKFFLEWYEVWFEEYGGKYVRSEVQASFEYDHHTGSMTGRAFKSEDDAERFYTLMRTETAYKAFVGKSLKKYGFPGASNSWSDLEMEAVRALFTPAELSLIAL